MVRVDGLEYSYYIMQTELPPSALIHFEGGNSGYYSTKIEIIDDVAITSNYVKKFINNLREATGLKFRIPTKLEWEYAAKGGNKSKNYTYSGSNNIDEVAWYNYNCNKPQDIAKKSPNELGLYDMNGNVQEWCNDRYGDYSSLPQHNPLGPSSGCHRVLRGGSWVYGTNECQVSIRDAWNHEHGFENHGFRLSLSL